MFQTVALPIIRSLALYTAMVYVVQVMLTACQLADGGQSNCPKNVEFYFENKFKKLMHLVGFVIKMYDDARSSERQIRIASQVQGVTMHFVGTHVPIHLDLQFSQFEWC